MKPAALVSDGESLEHTLEELRALGGKVFATPAAEKLLAERGIRAQTLGDPLGVARVFDFGHKEIHLFGFDLSNAQGEAGRVCFEDRVFYTDPARAKHAEMLVRACVELTAKGAAIGVHGDGMFPHMVRCVMRDLQERVLTAVYDMQVSPPTYEVFSFLAEAERYRAAQGFTAIDVVFAPGPMNGFRDDGLPPDAAERSSMLHRICVAGARLLPSVRNVHVMTKRSPLGGEFFPPDWTNERPRFCYGPRFQRNANQCIEATAAARAEIARRFPHRFTTITLRETGYWPARNSNLAAWSRAARWLGFEGLHPVVIPDTHGAGRLPEAVTFEPAAWDVDLRLAMYERAELNLGVVNGPMVLPMFSKAAPPYLIFQKPDETSPGTKEAFMRDQGIERGDHYTDNGWTIWEDDTPDNVERAVKSWFKEKRQAA